MKEIESVNEEEVGRHAVAEELTRLHGLGFPWNWHLRCTPCPRTPSPVREPAAHLL